MFFEIVKMLIAFVTCMVPPQKDHTFIGYELVQIVSQSGLKIRVRIMFV